jgi:hypothetical protein
VCQAEQRLPAPTVACNATGTVNSARTACVEVREGADDAPDSEQDLSGAPPDCPVAHMSEASTVNPKGWVTWLAHRTVSGGAPDYPVRHTTAAFTNGHFGGWGYKYPQPPHFNASKFFSHQTSYKSSRLHSKTQTKRLNPLPKSGITPNKLVTRERDFCVLLSSCAWIAFLIPLFLFPTHL